MTSSLHSGAGSVACGARQKQWKRYVPEKEEKKKKSRVKKEGRTELRVSKKRKKRLTDIWKIRGTLQVRFLHTFLILSSPSSQVLIISSCSLNVIILFYGAVNCVKSEFSCLLCFGSFPVTWIPLMNNCCVVLLF